MEYHSETARELATVWRSGLANYIKTQSEFGRVLLNTHQRWLGHMQATAELGPAFASKLLTAFCRLAGMGYAVVNGDGRKLPAAD